MSLTFWGKRTDVWADAGIVVTIYPMVNGARGAESYCHVIPQNSVSAGVYHLVTRNWTVGAGASFLVEVSATTSGAADGASVMGSNLGMAAAVN